VYLTLQLTTSVIIMAAIFARFLYILGYGVFFTLLHCKVSGLTTIFKYAIDNDNHSNGRNKTIQYNAVK